MAILATACVIAGLALRAEPDVRLVGEVGGGLLQAKCGEQVTFRFQVVGTNGVRVAVTRYADDGRSSESVTLTPDGEGRCAYVSSTGTPGALMAAAKVVTADGKAVQVKSGRRTVGVETALGVVCDPEKVLALEGSKPKDFDAFWDAERAALYALPIGTTNVTPTKVAGISAVSLDCLGGRPCTGYYTCPPGARAKSLPAKIALPGWNPGQRALAPRTAPTNRIEFLISIHGSEMEREKDYYAEFGKKLGGYAFGDKFRTPKDTSLYGIVMRTLKAIQFLKTRPEWNGELEVTGFSQGGFLTLMSAAMDPDVTKAVATCPWLCDFDRKTVGGMGGWTPTWNPAGSPYYLTCNFIPRITCPVEIRGGLVDRTCSPAGLLAAWHCFRPDHTDRSLSFYQRGGHGFKTEGVPEKDVLRIGAAPAIDIGSRLEVFWDDFIVDTSLTTAERRIHQPEYVGELMKFDRPWEGDGCGYHVIVPDRDAKGDFHRLYYRGWSVGMATPENTTIPKSEPCICYAESRDGGLTWTRPNLGMHAFNGSTGNNIMLGPKEFGFVWDNIFFFKDANPACPADERYKAIAGRLEKDEDFGLWCFLSADGIHWRKGWLVTKDGEFDSHNVAFWDPVTRKYHCYYRNHHFIEPHDRHDNVHARDIRHMTSADFRTWSKSERLSYGADVMDYALYTNCVMPYPRAPHLYVGFPTRYVMRKKEWTDTYDKLPGLENRRCRSKKDIRYGIAITDCAFMVTRDGVNFCREEDAFMDPGPENAFNWVYGDAYPYYGLLTAPGRRPGADPELMILCSDGYWSGRPQTMLRYALRMDGFVSRHAPDAGARLVTKPFVFDGAALQINFRTSAYGQVFVTLRTADGAKTIRSCEIFGNKIDRVVGFRDGRVADFAGQPVVLEFDMHDADIYSFRFR